MVSLLKEQRIINSEIGNNDMSDNRIEKLKEMIGGTPCKIAVLSHHNPDGDTLGAALAWAAYLRKLGHDVMCIAPNHYPYFLDWMSGIREFGVFKDDHSGYMARFVADADLLFCIDFNQINRLEGLSDAINANTKAKKIVIDHHLDPPHVYDLMFSDPTASSTSILVYRIFSYLGVLDMVDRDMAESLYVGIMTDTGNFSYSNLDAELFRAVAVLLDKGIDIPAINSAVYNNFSEDRMRMLGYVLYEKMVVMPEYGAAYMALSEDDLRRFNFRQGDNEGFVNQPLSISGVSMTALFTQTTHNIRISLRSRGDIDVNVFARRYFNGGGHKNAAGGRSFDTLDETVARYRAAVAEYLTLKGK